MMKRAFDICFTVSVLDHMPEPAAALRELARMSGKALYLLEPWLGSEGRVVRNYNERLEREIDTTPYSYSWDYPALVARVLPNWQLSQRPMPLPTSQIEGGGVSVSASIAAVMGPALASQAAVP